MELKQAKMIANKHFAKTLTKTVTKIPQALTIFNALFGNKDKVLGETIHHYLDENKHACANVTIIKPFNFHRVDGKVVRYDAKYRYQTQETTTDSAYATLAQHGSKIMWVFCDAIKNGDKWITWKDTSMDKRRECAGVVIDGVAYRKPEHEQPYIKNEVGVMISQRGIHIKLVMKVPTTPKMPDKEEATIEGAMTKLAEEACSNYPDTRWEIKCDMLVKTFDIISTQAVEILDMGSSGDLTPEEVCEFLVDWKEDNNAFIVAAIGMAGMVHSVDHILSTGGKGDDRDEEVCDAAEQLANSIGKGN